MLNFNYNFTSSLAAGAGVVCGEGEADGEGGGGGDGEGGGDEGGSVGVRILVVSVPNEQYKTFINPILPLVFDSWWRQIAGTMGALMAVSTELVVMITVVVRVRIRSWKIMQFLTPSPPSHGPCVAVEWQEVEGGCGDAWQGGARRVMEAQD